MNTSASNERHKEFQAQQLAKQAPGRREKNQLNNRRTKLGGWTPGNETGAMGLQEPTLQANETSQSRLIHLSGAGTF